MTVVWALVYLIVSAVNGGPVDMTFWDGWTVTLMIAVLLDILF